MCLNSLFLTSFIHELDWCARIGPFIPHEVLQLLKFRFIIGQKLHFLPRVAAKP